MLKRLNPDSEAKIKKLLNRYQINEEKAAEANHLNFFQ